MTTAREKWLSESRKRLRELWGLTKDQTDIAIAMMQDAMAVADVELAEKDAIIKRLQDIQDALACVANGEPTDDRHTLVVFFKAHIAEKDAELARMNIVCDAWIDEARLLRIELEQARGKELEGK